MLIEEKNKAEISSDRPEHQKKRPNEKMIIWILISWIIACSAKHKKHKIQCNIEYNTEHKLKVACFKVK